MVTLSRLTRKFLRATWLGSEPMARLAFYVLAGFLFMSVGPLLVAAQLEVTITEPGGRPGDTLGGGAVQDMTFPKTPDKAFSDRLCQRAALDIRFYERESNAPDMWWILMQDDWKTSVRLSKDGGGWKVKETSLVQKVGTRQLEYRGDANGFISLYENNEEGDRIAETDLDPKTGNTIRHRVLILVDHRTDTLVETDADGKETYRESYRYDLHGSLLGIERKAADGKVTLTSWSWNADGLAELTVAEGAQILFRTFDDDERVVSEEHFDNEKLVYAAWYEYDEKTKALTRSLVLDSSLKIGTDEYNDADGHVKLRKEFLVSAGPLDVWAGLETKQRDAKLDGLRLSKQESWEYTPEHHISKYTIKKNGSTELHEYGYQKDDMVFEKISKEGVPVAWYEYKGDEQILTSFRNGKAVHKTFTRNGERYREQELDGTKVLKDRRND